MGAVGVTVIGCGNGGMALAGLIASKGYLVNIFEGIQPTEAFLQLQKEKEITIKGDIQARGTINEVTTDISVALAQSDIILIVVPAYAHESVFEKLIPHLRDGHKVVIILGNFGTFKLRKMMQQYGINKKITVSELASLPFACRKITYNTVEVYKCKTKMKIASYPVHKNNEMLILMNTIMDIFFPGQNVLELSLDNFNCVLHPLPVLLNVGCIEKNHEKFRHYIDGISPAISELIHRMDEERLEIRRSYGLKLLPVLDRFKMYYGENSSADVYEYINSAQSPYKNLYGQKITSRYLTEDIPYLVVPSMRLGGNLGVKSPIMAICIKLASTLHRTDYMSAGTSLDKLGVEGFTKEEIFSMII